MTLKDKIIEIYENVVLETKPPSAISSNAIKDDFADKILALFEEIVPKECKRIDGKIWQDSKYKNAICSESFANGFNTAIKDIKSNLKR